MKPALQCWDRHQQNHKNNSDTSTHHPVHVRPLAEQGRAAGSPALPARQAKRRESSPAGRGPQSWEALPTHRLGHLSCLPVPPSLTVNNLLGSLSKINKNVLKFNLKNLALIIYFDCFDSSKRPVWEFLPQEGTLREAAELPWQQGVGDGRGSSQGREGVPLLCCSGILPSLLRCSPDLVPVV